MKRLRELLEGKKTVGIAGHVNPDGDCMGSTLALYRYLKLNYPSLDVDLFLESIRETYGFLPGVEQVQTQPSEKHYQVFFALDCGDEDRIAVARGLYDQADLRVNIDHHISNRLYGDEYRVIADSSSASEVLYGILEEDGGRIDKDIAECLYVGIVQDTGVFQYPTTGQATMNLAGKLMNYGIPYSDIIRQTFFEKTYPQMQVMGYVLEQSELFCDGKVLAGTLTLEEMGRYGAGPDDLDGVVSQMNQTRGLYCTIFLYEREPGISKLSLRSTGRVDVSGIAVVYGGGGHKGAAGATIEGMPRDLLAGVLEEVKKRL